MMRMLLLILLLTFHRHSTASENGNVTAKTTETDWKLSPGIFQQLLNQETIIRLSLTKNVQGLMRDVLTIKQTVLSTEADLKDVKKEADDLRKENVLLKNELSEHKKTFIDVNNNFHKINENFEEVRRNISDISENHRRFEIQVEKNAEYFDNKTSSSLGDLKTEMRYTSLTLLNLEKHSKEVEKSMPILMDDRLQVIFNSVNKTIGNLSLDALQLSMTEEINKAVNQVKMNFLENQNQQLRLSNSISALEIFRMNISNIIEDIGQPVHVGFTAGITSDNSYWSGYNLIFPKIISNIGGGYNPNNGVFTSPVDGNFVFYVSVVSYGSKHIQLCITVNGSGKVSAHPKNGNDESGSNLLFIHLQKGEKVAVQRTLGTGYESDPIPLMTFSGFKV